MLHPLMLDSDSLHETLIALRDRAYTLRQEVKDKDDAVRVISRRQLDRVEGAIWAIETQMEGK